jgi:soluble lytic murein transglycosylase-like protein
MLLVMLIGQMLSYSEDGTPVISNTHEVESEDAVAVEEPVYDEYDNIINYYCTQYGVDPQLVRIVIEKESRFNPNAVSRSGAIGLMQLMPETAEVLGVDDPYNPWENVMGGVKFLSQLFDMFDGNLELTLAAYHAGPTTVKKINRVPAIPETIEYVDYIMSRYSGALRDEPIIMTVDENGSPMFTNRPK